ncbi:MAG: oxidoreductase [Bacteroidetes bacterium]|nr:oxidoreductase [Bacteroidota bacterium]MBK8145943.1 oxidoreductase [Bacteroidota bacterium]MBP6314708.1 oxidoreductase [Chitinophagaceae bacterium]
MKAIVAGASGMIGKELLKQLLESKHYEQIYILVRQKIDHLDSNCIQIVYNFENDTPALPAVDHVFCCLGTTISKAGSREAFSKVDKQYPIQLAQITKANGASLYCIVTAGGANPKSSIFYNRVKGEVESELMTIGFDHLGIFRPSMLLGERNENRPFERAGQIVMTALDFLIPKRYKAIQGEKVARAMKNYSSQPSKEIRIFESDEMNAK